MFEKTVLLQQAERLGAEPGQEQFQHSSNSRAGGTPSSKYASSPDRLLGAGLDGEIELRREAHRPQHAHRIFAIAGFRIADQLQAPRADVATPSTKSQIEKSSML